MKNSSLDKNKNSTSTLSPVLSTVSSLAIQNNNNNNSTIVNVNPIVTSPTSTNDLQYPANQTRSTTTKKKKMTDEEILEKLRFLIDVNNNIKSSISLFLFLEQLLVLEIPLANMLKWRKSVREHQEQFIQRLKVPLEWRLLLNE